jgi:uncharacterized protein YacL
MGTDDRKELMDMLAAFRRDMLRDIGQLFEKINTADKSLAVVAEVQRTHAQHIQDLNTAVYPLRDKVMALELKTEDHEERCVEAHERWATVVEERKKKRWDIEKAVLAAVLVAIAVGLMNFVWQASTRQVTENIATQVRAIMTEERAAQGGGR